VKKKLLIISGLLVLPFFLISKDPVASPNANFQFVPPSPWQKSDMKGVDASWTIPGEGSHPSITISSDVNEDFLDPKNMNEAELIPSIEKTRAIPYRIFGISDWKIETHHISSYSEGLVLEFEGHYHSPSGIQVRFVERDYFLGFNSYSVIFSEELTGTNSKDTPTDNGQIKKWLDRFKAEKKSS
jgi:hypothetical protein